MAVATELHPGALLDGGEWLMFRSTIGAATSRGHLRHQQIPVAAPRPVPDLAIGNKSAHLDTGMIWPHAMP